jgi:3-deoxy-D-manno-octulosonic-acid transferase
VGVVETEIWPNFYFTCRELKLPLLIINGRIPAGDFSIYRRTRFLFRYPLSCVTCVGAQDENEARQFRAIGTPPERVRNVGNLKCELSVQAGMGGLPLGRQPVIVAGSTHPGEEKLILTVFRNLQREIPELRLVLAPRHSRRARCLCALTRRFGFHPVLRSQSDGINWRVLILDSMGELASLYRQATVVLVGGSFRNYGAHNFLEAAAFGKPAITGRFVSNFSTLAECFTRAGALLRALDGDELEANIRLLLQDEKYRNRIGNSALQTLTAQRGAAVRYWELLRANGLRCNR